MQQAIGRVQPFETVAAAVAMLRAAGIANLNFELMYGRPNQSHQSLHDTILRADALRPDRIALFGYAHVPWFKPHQRLIDEAALPGATERLAQAEIARGTLLALGYVPVGLDHFARPQDSLARAAPEGRLRRNFQGYTTDNADALIGIGASASAACRRASCRTRRTSAPMAARLRRRIRHRQRIALSADDRLRGAIIERLM